MGFTEMLLLAFLSYLLLGPKKTAELARELGQHVDKWKRAAGEMQEQFNLPLEAIGSETVNDKRQTIIGELGPGVTVHGKESTSETVDASAAAVTAAAANEPLKQASFASVVN